MTSEKGESDREKVIEEITACRCQLTHKSYKMTSFGLGLGGGFLGALTLVGLMKAPDMYYQSTTNSTQTIDNVSLPYSSNGWNEQCSALEDKVQNLTNTIQRLENDLNNNQTKLKNHVAFKNYIFDGRLEELNSIFLSKGWLLVILLLVLFETVVMVIVWNMWRQLADVLSRGINIRTQTLSGGGQNKIPGNKRTLEKVKCGNLGRSICIISFHSSTLQEHHSKVKAVMGDNQSLKVFQKHVSSHDDILDLPRSQLYVIFVDFNERNVILEDPTTGLGDVRLTTVQAISKMGGEIVLIYCGHVGSRTLERGKLYNSGLTSITRHSELRRLSSRQRVLTIRDDFNEFQRNHVTEVIKDTCIL